VHEIFFIIISEKKELFLSVAAQIDRIELEQSKAERWVGHTIRSDIGSRFLKKNKRLSPHYKTISKGLLIDIYESYKSDFQLFGYSIPEEIWSNAFNW